MTHERTLIRAAVKDAIASAGTAAGNRVWASREPPVNVETILVDEGPVILIYVRRDRTADGGHPASGEGAVRRVADLYVEVTVAGGDVLDDKLDDIVDLVEPIVDQLEIPDLPSAEIRHVETNIDTSQEFEQPIGGALITYSVAYYRAWRGDEGEDWFPHDVFASSGGNAPELVADCDDCEECPPGSQS